MENASKALLIAGGVLITMIVASFGVYLYGVYHDHSEKMLARMSEKEVSEFNAKFQVFEGKELTANEVVSILNLVRENLKNRQGEEYKINLRLNHNNLNNVSANTSFLKLEVYVKNLNKEDKNFQDDCNEFIRKYTINYSDKYIFKFNIISYHEENGIINECKIIISEKTT